MQIHEATIINGKVNAFNFSSCSSSWLNALLDAVVKLCSDLLLLPTKFWQMASLSDSDLGRNKGTKNEAESNPKHNKVFENHQKWSKLLLQMFNFGAKIQMIFELISCSHCS